MLEGVRGEMFFYRVSFPSSLGCPEAGFLIFLLYVRPPEGVSLELQPRAESMRQGEAERRPPLACCGTPAAPGPALLARTPLQSPSPNFLMKPAEVSAQRMLPRRWKRQPLQSHIPFHQAPASPAPSWPPARPRPDTRGKSICTVSCATPAATLRTR